MDADVIINVIWGAGFLLVVLIVALSRRARRHGGAYKAGVIGAMYEFQNRDKREALELIVENKAEETRPEYPDGNLPDLEDPRRRRGDA
jgi:hypothetical protein